MKSAPSILHLSSSDSGGAYVFAENLIHESRAQGLKADHVVFTGKEENYFLSKFKLIDQLLKIFLHAREKLIQFFYEKNKEVRFKFSLGYPGISASNLKRICKNYDIIHLHWINKGFINIKTLSEIKKPIIWTCHDLWPVSGGCHLSLGCTNFKSNCGNCHFLKKPSSYDLSAEIWESKNQIYKNLNLTFISPSEWMNNNIDESTLGKNRPHYTINNGVDTSIFKYTNSKINDKFVIGFVAANLNDKNKALYRLIEAINYLPNKESYKLLLIGNQKEDFDFHIPIEYQIISNVNKKEIIAEYYNDMDVLINTSSIETFPTILMEAYCCGTPCLGFKIGGIPEIINKMNGKCIEPFDLKELSKEILEMYHNKSFKDQISNKAQMIFSIKQTSIEYMIAYKKLHFNSSLS